MSTHKHKHGGARPGAGAPRRIIKLDKTTAHKLRSLARGNETQFVTALINHIWDTREQSTSHNKQASLDDRSNTSNQQHQS